MERIFFQPHKSTNYGFVQFKRADSARTILLALHYTGNFMFLKIRAASVWDQPDYNPDALHSLVNPPEQESPVQIVNALNDDCLREVFRLLPLIDLTNVADVCVRFNTVAKEVFSSKFANTIISDDSKSHIDYFELNFNSAEKLLRNFGQLMLSLEIKGQPFLNMEAFFLKLIGYYCSSSLQKLSLSKFRIKTKSQKFSTLMKRLFRCHSKFSQRERYCVQIDNRCKFPQFANLRELYLNECQINTLDMFSKCKKLSFFRMHRCSFSFITNPLMQLRTANLEEVHFTYNNQMLRCEINSFLKSMPTIRKLALRLSYNTVDDLSVIFRKVAKHLPRLEHLEFSVNRNSELNKCTKYLGQLKYLEVLKIKLNLYKECKCTMLLQTLVENSIPIKQLSIEDTLIDVAAIEQLVQLKGIQILKMNHVDGLNDEHLIKIGQEMPELQELHLQKFSKTKITSTGLNEMLQFANNLILLKLGPNPRFTFDADDYKAMSKTLKNRVIKKKLRIVV